MWLVVQSVLDLDVGGPVQAVAEQEVFSDGGELVAAMG